MNAVDAVRALGYSEIEALVYCELLRSRGATGYRIAKAIGKAQANTYQALAVLQQKGAVERLADEPGSYLAVPPDELITRISRDFSETASRARRLLSAIEAPADEAVLSRLATVDQVFERARYMIANAGETVVYELFPLPIETLKPDLTAAAARGLRVTGVVFRPEDVAEEIDSVQFRRGELPLQRWPGQQMTLVVDAMQALVVLFNKSGNKVLHGYWTDSVYLACLLHGGVLGGIAINKLDPLRELGSLNMRLIGKVPSGYLVLLQEDAESEQNVPADGAREGISD